MSSDNVHKSPVSIILGAGASRAVSYDRHLPSPLDCDFFDLLQRLKPHYKGKSLEKTVREAKEFVIREGLAFENGKHIGSMEKLFYTLHQYKVLRHELLPEEFPKNFNPADELRKKFTIAIQGVLRAAHGRDMCDHHKRLFRPLRACDALITFNYDLVVERALRALHESTSNFGSWLYGVGDNRFNVPTLHKLHGSVNWEEGEGITPRQKSWSEFDDAPGYGAFNILLPYWEKRFWKPPWKKVWQRAVRQLQKSERLIVWGYSLPLTDAHARNLLRVSFDQDPQVLKDVCIIDPSPRTRQRWRQVLPLRRRFWAYEDIAEFFDTPPPWYSMPT